jgi:hypothetical protein
MWPLRVAFGSLHLISGLVRASTPKMLIIHFEQPSLLQHQVDFGPSALWSDNLVQRGAFRQALLRGHASPHPEQPASGRRFDASKVSIHLDRLSSFTILRRAHTHLVCVIERTWSRKAPSECFGCKWGISVQFLSYQVLSEVASSSFETRCSRLVLKPLELLDPSVSLSAFGQKYATFALPRLHNSRPSRFRGWIMKIGSCT